MTRFERLQGLIEQAAELADLALEVTTDEAQEAVWNARARKVEAYRLELMAASVGEVVPTFEGINVVKVSADEYTQDGGKIRLRWCKCSERIPSDKQRGEVVPVFFIRGPTHGWIDARCREIIQTG